MAAVFCDALRTAPEDFRRATEVTYLGAVWGTQAALKRMKPRNRGVIIQVGSALAYRSIPLRRTAAGTKLVCVRHERRGLMPGRDKLPSTLKRSPAKAQRTWIKTHDHALEEYGEGARAHRTAFAALKHSFEKKGDCWVPKDHKGPSDPRAKKSGRAARGSSAPRGARA
jgi:NAD(P)-dependent dehydrogenase (short-subunit alcohol dehydrogenase family)